MTNDASQDSARHCGIRSTTWGISYGHLLLEDTIEDSYKTQFSRIDIHKFSFFSATVRLWNSLPDSIVNLDFPEAFQKSAAATFFEQIIIFILNFLLT